MFFNSKPDYIIYLMRSSLEIATSKVSARLELPEDVISNLEVLNPQKFSELLSNFFITNNINREKFMVVLDESVIFHKEYSLPLSSNELTKIKGDFLAALPFDDRNRQMMSLSKKQTLMLVGVNNQLYAPILNAADQTRNKIVSVSPSSLFGINSIQRLTKSLVQAILRQSSSARKVSFWQ